MHVIATAGHVDHGKSSLVRTLTGTDPDRWAEEKARGLTIDLGFAHTTLPSGAGLSFIDVPGHIRFLKNMLAGVGAVDACLFVVAATEGWKPQSEEHLRILELLGLEHGVIALTKIGLVDDEWRELARMDVVDRVAGTFLADAQIVEVDSLAGTGMEELRATLDGLLVKTPTAKDVERPRLWIDRVFAARGSGTVVTGTLTGGNLAVDDLISVVGPGRERADEVRVRAIQSHGSSHARIGPGNRVAVNLAGVHHEDLLRGHALVRAEQWHLSTRVDASLRTLASLDHEVSRRGAYAAYIGSGEYPIRMRILGPASLVPGEDGLVRLHFPCALPLVPGDRFIVREHGRGETVGGGEVLDVAPVRPASKARPDRSVDRVIAERGWVDRALLERLTGVPWKGPLIGGNWVAAPDAVDQVKDKVKTMVAGAGPMGLDVALLDDRARAVLPELAAEGIAVEAGWVKRGDVVDPLADHPFVKALEASPFSPPDATGVDRGELRELIRRALVIERDGVWFAPSAIEAAGRKIAALLADQPDGVTVAEVRDALAVTRKHAVPLLAHLDSIGMTRRRGDLRIAGPRLQVS